MGKSRLTPKEIVRIRSEGLCEKCARKLTRNHNGIPDGGTARSIHHRQKRSEGGRDSVVCMVNLCLDCHIGIHRDEKQAEVEGWICARPDRQPFASWRGWVLPTRSGSLTLLDWTTGRTSEIPLTREIEPGTRNARRRKRVARRPQYDRRARSRQLGKVA